ncbi:MAG: hypothetical protein SGPRY_009257 [Prymnesium sp.]
MYGEDAHVPMPIKTLEHAFDTTETYGYDSRNGILHLQHLEWDLNLVNLMDNRCNQIEANKQLKLDLQTALAPGAFKLPLKMVRLASEEIGAYIECDKSCKKNANHSKNAFRHHAAALFALSRGALPNRKIGFLRSLPDGERKAQLQNRWFSYQNSPISYLDTRDCCHSRLQNQGIDARQLNSHYGELVAHEYPTGQVVHSSLLVKLVASE